MNCLLGGPLLVGGLGPGPPGAPLKSGPGTYAMSYASVQTRTWGVLGTVPSAAV